MGWRLKAITLEEKVAKSCGTEKAEEIMEIISNHFQIEKIELNTYSKVRVTSDNSPFHTKVEFGENRKIIPVQSIRWTMKGPDEIGQLHLLFL